MGFFIPSEATAANMNQFASQAANKAKAMVYLIKYSIDNINFTRCCKKGTKQIAITKGSLAKLQ